MALSRIASCVAALAAMALAAGAEASAQTRAQTVVTHVIVVAGKPSEFRFTLSKKAVHRGRVSFRVENKGALPHTFKICASPKGGHANACAGKATKTVSPGRSISLAYTFRKPGRYEYICTIAGHAAAGMKGVLRVT